VRAFKTEIIMKNKKSLKELIELATKENKCSEEMNNKVVEKESLNFKQKGFHSLEIDNDNGMCVYDFLYNDM
jgi:hypothetical protein